MADVPELLLLVFRQIELLRQPSHALVAMSPPHAHSPAPMFGLCGRIIALRLWLRFIFRLLLVLLLRPQRYGQAKSRSRGYGNKTSKRVWHQDPPCDPAHSNPGF